MRALPFLISSSAPAKAGREGVSCELSVLAVAALKRLLQVSEGGETSFPADSLDHLRENGNPREGEEAEEWDAGGRPEATESSRRHPSDGRPAGWRERHAGRL